jgi:hypothetical protein
VHKTADCRPEPLSILLVEIGGRDNDHADAVFLFQQPRGAKDLTRRDQAGSEIEP